MRVQVICQEHSRRTNLKGFVFFLDGEQDVSLSMRAVSWRGGALGLAAESPTGSSIMPKMFAVTCQRLIGQFIFNSVTKRVSVYYPISSIVVCPG